MDIEIVKTVGAREPKDGSASTKSILIKCKDDEADKAMELVDKFIK